MAGSIQEYFGIDPVFVEGHDGIFEVSINKDIIYTNNSKCSMLPETNSILKKILLHGGNPVKPIESISAKELSLEGAACPFPGTHSSLKQHLPVQRSITGLHDDRTAENDGSPCGCNSC